MKQMVYIRISLKGKIDFLLQYFFSEPRRYFRRFLTIHVRINYFADFGNVAYIFHLDYSELDVLTCKA